MDICHNQRAEQIHNEQYDSKQKSWSVNSQTQTAYVGNVSDNTTENNLYEFFGLRGTKYLKQNCRAKMQMNSNTGNKKYFPYASASQHVATELTKLNGIQFNTKCIIVEEEENKPATFSEANVPRPTLSVWVNI